MSSTKRRRAEQVARLIRLDATHSRLYLMSSPHRDGPRAKRLWWACIVPLGDKIGAWHALPRCDVGTAILVARYRERNR